MSRTVFINRLKNCQWSETILSSLRDECVARFVVDIGIRNNTVSREEYDFWNKKTQESEMEIAVINLLIGYINGDYLTTTTASTVGATAAAESTTSSRASSEFTESTPSSRASAEFTESTPSSRASAESIESTTSLIASEDPNSYTR